MPKMNVEVLSMSLIKWSL